MLEKMLFPTDLSKRSLGILNYLSDFKKIGVRKVGLLFVINTTKLSDVSGGIDIDGYIESESEKAEKEIGPVAERIREEGFEVEIINPFPTGDPVVEILRISEDYDFIVINSRGASAFKTILLGSVSEGVIRGSKKPVYVFKCTENPSPVNLFNKILVAYDFSEHSKITLEYAKYVASSAGSEVHILHVAEPGCGHTGLEDLAEELKKEGIRAFAYTEPGGPNKVILRKQQEIGATTIFMGSRGLSVVKSLLLGSTSDSVIRHSPVPVFVCKVVEDED